MALLQRHTLSSNKNDCFKVFIYLTDLYIEKVLMKPRIIFEISIQLHPTL